MNDFLKKMETTLQDFVEIEVRTLVGEMTYSAKDEKLDFKDGQQVEAMISTIDIATGDIDTKITPKFLADYSSLKEYHQLKEAKGQDIMNKNLELIERIAQTLNSLRNTIEETAATSPGSRK